MATATPSLTLRALLSRAASTAGLDRSSVAMSGLTAPAKALSAVIAARTGTGVTLLVVPTDKDAEQLTRDARFFYGALEGASDAAVDRAVLPFPSLQIDPYRGMTPHFRVAAARGARAACCRDWHRQTDRGVRSGAAAACRDPRAPAEGRDRDPIRYRDRAAGTGRSARRRRVHARGPGRRARRIHDPRRHRRRLSGRRRRTRSHRIRRRHGRDVAALRSGDAALDPTDRSDPDRSST